MKVLEVANFDVGACGPTSVLRQIINRLNHNGYRLDVFSPHEYCKKREALANSLGSNYFSTNGEYLLNNHTFKKYIPELFKYDIVHLHGIYNINHIILCNMLHRNSIPYIISIHGGLMPQALKHNYFKKQIAIILLIKEMLLNSSGIHVLTREEMDAVKKIVGAHNYYHIYNGVDEEANIISKVNGSDLIKILFVGRLDVNHKGIDLLIKALSNNLEYFAGRVKLYMVGPFQTNKDMKIIMGKINSNPLLKKIVIIVGPKYGVDKQSYYNECDLFIHTSRYEGMPMAVLEAMNVGMPSLVTTGTNMTEIIDECNGGIVVDTNVDAIANGLKKAIDRRNDLKEMGCLAKQWSKKNLSWNNIAEEYGKMYHDIIRPL